MSSVSGNQIPKILIPSPDCPQTAIDILREKCEVVVVKEQINPSRVQILNKIYGVDGILWTSKVPVDKEIIEAAGPKLKVVSTMSAGLDHVDISALQVRGIALGYTPKVADDSVADIAVMLILASMRRLQEGREHILRGTWVFGMQWNLGQDIRGSTVGIVGMGGIGQNIVKRLKAFHVAKFLYSGYSRPEATINTEALRQVSFDELVKKSDVIVAACPLTNETRNMFNKEAFQKMKTSAVFVNVGRSGVVDQPALIEALENRTIFAAGLDVMNPEPLPKDHALLSLPNCVITPHLGSATVMTRNKMAELAARNILAGLEGLPLPASAF